MPQKISGCSKIVGGLAKLKVRDLPEVQVAFTFGLVAYNLMRLPNLLQPPDQLCRAGGK